MAAQIRQQIEMLSANLAVLEGSKTKNHKLIKDTKANLDRVMQSTAPPKAPKKSSGARKSSTAGADAGPPAAAAGKSKKAKASDGAGAGSSKKAVKNGKSSKKAAYGSDEDTPRAVTYEQKEELAAKITELDGDRLDQAIRIIHEDRPELKNNDEEIELDIDALNPRTLYKLYKFVVRPPKPRNKPVAPTGKNAPIDGRKRGTGGLKRKNLDESEEAERIARLQQQLQQFDQPGKSEYSFSGRS